MKVTITSLQLKGPFKFFALSLKALKIVRQLKSASCVEFKKSGFWTTHYTMSLWNSNDDLRSFASSGAHLEAMKSSKSIAKEIRTYTYDADALPDWKSAKRLLLENGKVLRF